MIIQILECIVVLFGILLRDCFTFFGAFAYLFASWRISTEVKMALGEAETKNLRFLLINSLALLGTTMLTTILAITNSDIRTFFIFRCHTHRDKSYHIKQRSPFSVGGESVA